MNKRIKKFINHPRTLKTIKSVLSNKLIANNPLYKSLVMKKAKRLALINREFKDQIFIETALTCNSRCIFCGHHNKEMTGIMAMDLFKKIIDECYGYGIRNIILGVYGEIFVDKDLIEKIKYLRKYNMNYNIITNASLLFPKITDRLFELGGLTCVNFSVNGFSREVYEKTMVGLKRDATYDNIFYFLKQTERRHLHDIEVTVSAVETKINKDDFEKFYQFWKKQKGVASVQSAELIDRMGTEYDEAIGELGPMTKKTNWLSPCRLLWGPLNVYHDGKVGPCCADNDMRKLIIGDLMIQSIRDISMGKTLNNLRELHLAGKRKDHPVCGKCYLNSIWLR